jgi:hypothetical protein
MKGLVLNFVFKYALWACAAIVAVMALRNMVREFLRLFFPKKANPLVPAKYRLRLSDVMAVQFLDQPVRGMCLEPNCLVKVSFACAAHVHYPCGYGEVKYGSWIVTEEDGTTWVCGDADFCEDYKPVG